MFSCLNLVKALPTSGKNIRCLPGSVLHLLLNLVLKPWDSSSEPETHSYQACARLAGLLCPTVFERTVLLGGVGGIWPEYLTHTHTHVCSLTHIY